MRISEIFLSIQGEGIYQGMPMVFVRLAGCPLLPHCKYCDTSYAWEPSQGKEITVGDIIQEVSKLSPYYQSWICLTGGEPLWQGEGLEQLVRLLKGRGCKVTVETNGMFLPPTWWTLVDSWSVDIKCPSSGVCGVSKEDWWGSREADQIKFVVGTKEDLEFARKQIMEHKVKAPTVLVSPVIPVDGGLRGVDTKWLQEVVKFCIEVRVNFSLQWHKIIWGNKKGV